MQEYWVCQMACLYESHIAREVGWPMERACAGSVSHVPGWLLARVVVCSFGGGAAHSKKEDGRQWPTVMALRRDTPQVANLMALWLRASTDSVSTISIGMLVQPYWALDTPRTMQSPLMEDWRKSQFDLGLPVSTAMEEEKAGMGSRSTKSDDRPFLVED